ncbi:hypothetical protein ACGC1H_002087 [Rhizoctonia solani]
MKFQLPGLLALVPLVLAKPSKDNLETKVQKIKSAMLASIRTSWEQGVAADALAELDFPEYSVYGYNETKKTAAYPLRDSANRRFPLLVIQFGLSAAVRQSADGRLSQIINGDADGAALDGASAGLAVLIGKYIDNSYSDYLGQAAEKQLNYVLNTAPRTSTGAISHRAATRDYWQVYFVARHMMELSVLCYF